jgi:hypothetical protein
MLRYCEWYILEFSNGVYRVYHGGLWDGKKLLKINGRGSLGVGAYFSGDINKARSYADESGGNLLEVEVRLNKPLILGGIFLNPAVEGLVKLGVNEKKAIQIVEKDEEIYGYIGSQLKNLGLKQGYDGIIQLDKVNKSEISELVVWSRDVVSVVGFVK